MDLGPHDPQGPHGHLQLLGHAGKANEYGPAHGLRAHPLVLLPSGQLRLWRMDRLFAPPTRVSAHRLAPRPPDQVLLRPSRSGTATPLQARYAPARLPGSLVQELQILQAWRFSFLPDSWGTFIAVDQRLPELCGFLQSKTGS
ncbi:type III endosome membrane protein TEMP isoform X1 [Dromiciops gliroides]|uniref:type III endosome membrane protein TEMP isoform X1 n=1 Tax=Dromiciops gliroides TaxID=33562 RepID=UPI001CC38E7B|nr:type III endosome membrane protein TEMP isoform X1 [Dromiciops gliroides]